MPDLLGKYFEGDSDIPAEKVEELLTKGNNEAVIRALTKLGWEGQPIATVTLRVSTDGNTRTMFSQSAIFSKFNKFNHLT